MKPVLSSEHPVYWFIVLLTPDNELKNSLSGGTQEKNKAVLIIHRGSDECSHSDYWTNQYKVQEKTIGRETVRITVLVKKTYFSQLAAAFIAFTDIIYLAIKAFHDPFSNQVVSLCTGEKWLWYSILFVPLEEEIPYPPAYQKLHFQNCMQAIVTSAVKKHHRQCWHFGPVINVGAK